jgi:hypothetical protein
VLLVDAPQVVADHLVGDGVDVLVDLLVERQPGVDVERRARDVGVLDAVEDRHAATPARSPLLVRMKLPERSRVTS